MLPTLLPQGHTYIFELMEFQLVHCMFQAQQITGTDVALQKRKKRNKNQTRHTIISFCKNRIQHANFETRKKDSNIKSFFFQTCIGKQSKGKKFPSYTNTQVTQNWDPGNPGKSCSRTFPRIILNSLEILGKFMYYWEKFPQFHSVWDIFPFPETIIFREIPSPKVT